MYLIIILTCHIYTGHNVSYHWAYSCYHSQWYPTNSRWSADNNETFLEKIYTCIIWNVDRCNVKILRLMLLFLYHIYIYIFPLCFFLYTVLCIMLCVTFVVFIYLVISDIYPQRNYNFVIPVLYYKRFYITLLTNKSCYQQREEWMPLKSSAIYFHYNFITLYTWPQSVISVVNLAIVTLKILLKYKYCNGNYLPR